MKVLLLSDIERVGNQGDVVEVKDGFARNYLIPKKLACLATQSAYKQLEIVKRKQKKLEQNLVQEATQIKETLQKIPVINIEVRANEQGVLYGSITPSMIADALKDIGIKIEGNQVEIPQSIKQKGEYEIVVNLYKAVKQNIKINVVAGSEIHPVRDGASGRDPPRAVNGVKPETPQNQPNADLPAV